MSIKVGTYLRVETKPSPGQQIEETPFGTCVWQVTEVGLECPEPWRKKDAKGNDLSADQIPQDGVKCVMIGGTGSSARAGYTVIDSLLAIEKNMADGITTILAESDVARVEEALKNTAQAQVAGNASTGCVEID